MIEPEFTKQLEAYERFKPIVTVKIRDIPLVYSVPNRMAMWRVETILTKEPSTIAWLDSFETGSTLLDIGANVGMYSIYAAKMRDAQVYSFEPESQNYALLNTNIHTNGLSNKIKAFCAGFSERDGLDTLYLSQFALGSSCHSLGEEVGFDLEPRKSPFAQGAISFSVDSAIAKGLIPVPDYIKIDVDGFEHKVLLGARETLGNPKVKSIIIELNPHLNQHMDAVRLLEELGFEYSQNQVDFAARDEGTFKGVGEWIFRRKSVNKYATHTLVPQVVKMDDLSRNFAQKIVEKINAAKLVEHPYPHMIVDNIFPENYYKEIQNCFPELSQMIPISETGRTKNAYKERMVTLFNDEGFSRLNEDQQKFWGQFGGWLYSPEFINGVIEKFWPYVKDRLDIVSKRLGVARVSGDALLVNDQENYVIGPHTDRPHRLITFLFYMPEDEKYQQLGTGIYEPKDSNFSCEAGLHHSADKFNLKEVVSFIPNRLLIFVRTDRSFHGVEAITEKNVERRLLINNIRLVDS